MIGGFEIALLILGVMGLTTGKLTFTRNRVVRGLSARLLGLVGLLPLPTSFLAGLALALNPALQQSVPGGTIRQKATLLEGGITITCVLVFFALGWFLGKPAPPPTPPRSGS